jgi:fatty acid desaturase
MDHFLERVLYAAAAILPAVVVGQLLFALHLDLIYVLLFTVVVARIFHTIETIYLEASMKQDKSKNKQENKVQDVPAKK